MAVQRKESDVVKALRNVCKAEDVRKETELMMKPYANWEEYLMPGPISIAILGELACISAGQGDFSINKNPPTGGFKYIKYPDSFLTCLMQVSNKGWEAFNIAHKNMDQIRLLSMSVPEQMKTIVQILFQDTEVVQALLPGQLTSMKSIADECTSLALAVESKFSDVIRLIQELLEACLSSKSGYEKELEETRRTLEGVKLKQKAAEAAKKEAEEYYNSIRKKVDETYQDYRKAMDSIPEGWDAVAMNFVASLADSMTTVPRAVANLTADMCKYLIGESEHSGDEANGGAEDDPIALCNICSHSVQLASLGNALNQLVDEEGNINMGLLYNEKDQQVKSSWTKETAEQLLEKINKEKECSVKGMAVEICTSVIGVCQTLAEIATSGKKDVDKKSLKEKIKHLLQKVDLFDSKSKSRTGAPPFAPKTPNMAKYEDSCQGKMAGSVVMTNAHFKIVQSQEMLKITEEEYQRSFENFKQQNEELTEILITMRACETKEIDFDTARKMLIKGLDALGRVKEQWEKMVRFFQMISSLIESCLSRRIAEFVTTAGNVCGIANYSSNDFVKDLIYKQAFNASNVAHLVHMISETYTEVSSNYLMDKVSSLGRLISMEPSDPKFQAERLKLAAGCDDARQAIEDLVIKKKREFESNIRGRVEKISSELMAALPEVTKTEQKAIEDTVQKGMRDMSLQDANQFI
ncbi:uncharacterized protein LOC129326900 [Eublepharis macularius]|uniref:Uncharacterized protein LOC129326900 n=1 Tax=Eublepharis macularius TaxID=481883 RepID=A0AA97KU71_EUBMA|nr:uncharacterized protein LOC129326900 [Eublepharis macularius]